MMKERMDENELAKQGLAEKISGEIVLSERAGKTIKKWREIFKIHQHELAEEIGVMPSVISDYESCRRKSPGIKMIKKIVDGMIRLDERSGGKLIKEFSSLSKKSIVSAVLDMLEFTEPIGIKDFLRTIKGKLVNKEERELFGYSIIDSLKAIVNSTPEELIKLYGPTTERAMIFTKITVGRSPLVAIKVTNLRPALVVLHGIKKVDDIALRIAKTEGIALAITNMKMQEMIKKLRKRYS